MADILGQATLPFNQAGLWAREMAFSRLPEGSPYRVTSLQVDRYLALLQHERWSSVERGRALTWLATTATFQTITAQIAWLQAKVAQP